MNVQRVAKVELVGLERAIKTDNEFLLIERSA